MNTRLSILRGMPLIAMLLLTHAMTASADATTQPAIIMSDNAMGVAATISATGAIDLANPFFQSLGSNGRSCGTCHQAQDGWTVTPKTIRARFDATGGTDPIFRTNDGAVSPYADVSTVATRLRAYDMLLTKGLIRVGIGIPANAEFQLVGVDDPYGYASAAELSLFRRPLPSTNLRFLSTVMWDGRETFKDPASADCTKGANPACFASLHFNLADQANAATLGHAQGAQSPSTSQLDAIVDFEANLYTAQFFDDEAGLLSAGRVYGGPSALAGDASWFGINDVVSGDLRTGAAFNAAVFDLYAAWASLPPAHSGPASAPIARVKMADNGPVNINAARRAIARGEALFNSKPINITGVKGLNDDLHVAAIQGTCTTCHDTPNAGNHSTPAPLDIGIADASRRTPDMPLYTLRNNVTLETISTTDPGRALITGKWADIGRFKGPTLRALATRAPYFHNGSAKDLVDVVNFYDTRFNVGFTADEKDDLVAFLLAL
jgi:cytochrome c peroxidase